MTHPRDWGEWPSCAHCGRRRHTVCPSCGMAGTHFPLAEYLASGEPQRDSRQPRSRPDHDTQDRPELTGGEDRVVARGQAVWLLCPQCDEAFVPHFYRCCPACGGDAGSGIEMQPAFGEHLPKRALLVLYCLAALGGLLLLYFWFLFRGP